MLNRTSIASQLHQLLEWNLGKRILRVIIDLFYKIVKLNNKNNKILYYLLSFKFFKYFYYLLETQK